MPVRVLILTKADPRDGNTANAQGGIAAAVGANDSPALHAADTLAAGDGLCDPQAVDVLVGEGPAYVRELMAWGARFDLEPDGSPALAMEGAHSARRVLHARDATGREIGADPVAEGVHARRRPHRRSCARRRAPGDRRRRPGSVHRGESPARRRQHRLRPRRTGAARDRRCRPCLQRYDQPAGGDGRRHHDGLSRRRRGLRSGVRAVPPDGAAGRGPAAIPAVGSAARRRREADQRVRRSIHARATIRPAISRRAIASPAPSSRKPGAPARRCICRWRTLDAGVRARSLSVDCERLPRRRPRSRARPDPRRSGSALRHGRRQDGSRRPDVDRWPVRRRRGRVHGRARRQPPREQLAARGSGLRRPRRPRDAGGAAARSGPRESQRHRRRADDARCCRSRSPPRRCSG